MKVRYKMLYSQALLNFILASGRSLASEADELGSNPDEDANILSKDGREPPKLADDGSIPSQDDS